MRMGTRLGGCVWFLQVGGRGLHGVNVKIHGNKDFFFKLVV